MKALRATTLLTGVLLLAPALALWLLPRPQAEGLERLLPEASLLQSFPAAPERSVPLLWQERLGPRAAERLWHQQRGVWWQFWSRDGDGGAFLAFSQPVPVSPASALRVGELVVLAPDPLSRQQLQDQLKHSSRQRRGLERRCLERLHQGQAVYWSPIGLAELTGPLAPLLQHARQGCLSLVPSGRRLLNGLDFIGEASADPGVLGPPPIGADPAAPPPLADGTLLQVDGPSLAPLFDSLLARQLIREPLASRYGVGPAQLKLLMGVPFRLRLRAIPRGPFQAGLDLQLAVGRDRKPWAELLRDLRQGLLDQNLQEAPAQIKGATTAELRTNTLPAAQFLREDGTILGGWRWQASGGGDPQLVLFLGPTPPAEGPAVSTVARIAPLQVQALPAAVNRLGLMPPLLPQLLRQADLLQLSLSPTNQPLSLLTGRLRLSGVR